MQFVDPTTGVLIAMRWGTGSTTVVKDYIKAEVGAAKTDPGVLTIGTEVEVVPQKGTRRNRGTKDGSARFVFHLNVCSVNLK